MTLRAILLSLIMAVAFAGPALARCADYVPQPKPQNASRDIVGADLDTIVERGYIEFAAYEDFAPWSYEEGGEIKGVDIDIARVIAGELGVEPRFRLVAAGENLQADLRNWVWKGPIVGGRVANVMLHIPYDSEFACRVEQVVFTGRYHEEEVAIAYRREVYPDDPPVPAYFRFDTVAVENDSIADFYLSALAGGQLRANIRRFPTTQDAMQALANGEVKAAMGPRAQLEFGLTGKLDVHTPPLPGFAVGKWVSGVAVHMAYRALGYAVDDAIYSAMQDGRMDEIFTRYGLTHVVPKYR